MQALLQDLHFVGSLRRGLTASRIPPAQSRRRAIGLWQQAAARDLGKTRGSSAHVPAQSRRREAGLWQQAAARDLGEISVTLAVSPATSHVHSAHARAPFPTLRAGASCAWETPALARPPTQPPRVAHRPDRHPYVAIATTGNFSVHAHQHAVKDWQWDLSDPLLRIQFR